MIAPGTLCRLHNPISVGFAFYTSFDDEPELLDNDKHLFLIVMVPIRHAGRNEHFAWGLLNDGRFGFVNYKWLIEVRDG